MYIQSNLKYFDTPRIYHVYMGESTEYALHAPSGGLRSDSPTVNIHNPTVDLMVVGRFRVYPAPALSYP